jgi:ribonucleoside-diphosphate reductase alpha chain
MNTGKEPWDEPVKVPELSSVRVVASSPIAAKVQKQAVKVDNGLDAVNAQGRQMQSDAPACNTCGHITVRSGTCYKCMNCGIAWVAVKYY